MALWTAQPATSGAVAPARCTPAMGYRGKLVERDEARRLRADGGTLAEIAARLSVSKGSASLWTRDVPFTPRPRGPGEPRARRRGPNALQLRKEREIAWCDELGREQVGDLSDRDLLIAGIALYAGEGAKTDGTVMFANTNVAMVRLHCRWLRRFFDVEESRMRAKVYLHQGLDLEAAMAFWSEATRIPLTQFTKPYRAAADATRRTSKHTMGCIYGYACSATHRRIMALIDALLSHSNVEMELRGRDSDPQPIA